MESRYSQTVAVWKIAVILAVIAIASFRGAGPAVAQFGIHNQGQFELSDSVDIKTIPNEASAHLVRVDALLADGKWDEAVETLRRVSEDFGSHLMNVSQRRYLTVRDYCHIRIAGLPPEALDLYRRRADAVANAWYEKAIAGGDEQPLRRIVEQSFCSSVSDQALLALGDRALEQGKYGEARWNWERISPQLRASDGLSFWHNLYGIDLADKPQVFAKQFERTEIRQPEDWLVYPDTDIDLADVRARLVLASIMQDAAARARWELDIFARLHPQAAGHLAGRTGKYHEILNELLDAQSGWHQRRGADDWTTFAGAAERSRLLAGPIDISPRADWNARFSEIMPPRSGGILERPTVPTRYSASEQLLGFHPLVAGNLVLFNSSEQVFALDARSGKPAFNGSRAGQIFPRGDMPVRTTGRIDRIKFSAPRYTMTVYNDRLFARIGTQVTARPPGFASGYAGNRLICLDLKKEGSLKWRYPSGDRMESEFDRNRWAFEGPPLTDGHGVYVAMRRSESRAESHIACFDFQSGAMRWRRKICAADTPSHGQQNEMTHNLLTLAEGVLYLNTNLGAVVALTADDGAIRWVYHYPRARSGDLTEPPPHFYRDLNPCIYYQGLIIVAPSDSRFIFGLDSGTGKLVWRSAPMDAHPMHLLGVGKGNLIATGKSIWWFNAVTGRADFVWPEASDRNALRGYGRGLLAAGNIYWPTREKIYVFDQRVVIENGRRGVLQKPAIQLLRPDVEPDQQVTGGNLVVGGGMLLVAGGEELQAFPIHSE